MILRPSGMYCLALSALPPATRTARAAVAPGVRHVTAGVGRRGQGSRGVAPRAGIRGTGTRPAALHAARRRAWRGARSDVRRSRLTSIHRLPLPSPLASALVSHPRPSPLPLRLHPLRLPLPSACAQSTPCRRRPRRARTSRACPSSSCAASRSTMRACATTSSARACASARRAPGEWRVVGWRLGGARCTADPSGSSEREVWRALSGSGCLRLAASSLAPRCIVGARRRSSSRYGVCRKLHRGALYCFTGADRHHAHGQC